MDHALFFSLQLEQYPDHADVMRQFAETNGIPFDLERIHQLIEARQRDNMLYNASTPSEPASTDSTDNLGHWRQYINAKRSRLSETKHLNQTSPAQQGDAGVSLHGPELVEAVVAHRRQLGITQAAFAQRLGISVRTYQDWEQRRRRPSGPAESMLRRQL
nr:helix-turn-helix domain-containing protein [uncultured Halomonas sp.]